MHSNGTDDYYSRGRLTTFAMDSPLLQISLASPLDISLHGQGQGRVICILHLTSSAAPSSKQGRIYRSELGLVGLAADFHSSQCDSGVLFRTLVHMIIAFSCARGSSFQDFPVSFLVASLALVLSRCIEVFGQSSCRHRQRRVFGLRRRRASIKEARAAASASCSAPLTL